MEQAKQDDVLQLEADLARVLGAPVEVVHRAVVLYITETGDDFMTLMLAVYWLYREDRQDHLILQRFQRCLSRAMGAAE